MPQFSLEANHKIIWQQKIGGNILNRPTLWKYNAFKTMRMPGNVTLTIFSNVTFLSFFSVNDCSESALKSDFNSRNRFFKVYVFLEFSFVLLCWDGWLWLQLFRTWSHVTGYKIIEYRSSGSHLEGDSKSCTDEV